MPLIKWKPTKWDQAMQRGVLLHDTIPFKHSGSASQGIQMQVLSLPATMMQGASDPVLAHTGRDHITLRIIWPGYEHVNGVYRLEVNPGGRPITRGQLAIKVAENFAGFVKKCRSNPVDSPPPEVAKWDPTLSGIRYEHLVLVALENVCDGVWQAHVAVDLR
ncbi:hypothetical protein H0H92_008064 [Tricholoma furcatifolium]|nr:hypothetical protein H0H92_008064 [Tricholoma furcatifolium]